MGKILLRYIGQIHRGLFLGNTKTLIHLTNTKRKKLRRVAYRGSFIGNKLSNISYFKGAK